MAVEQLDPVDLVDALLDSGACSGVEADVTEQRGRVGRLAVLYERRVEGRDPTAPVRRQREDQQGPERLVAPAAVAEDVEAATPTSWNRLVAA